MANPQSIDAFIQGLQRSHGVEVHFDRNLVAAYHENLELGLDFLVRLRRWGSLIMILALAGIAVALGRPRLGVRLDRGEMMQALAVRGGVAALTAWILTGAVVSLVARRLGIEVWEGAWWFCLWILPVGVALGPLGIFGGRREFR